MFKRGWIVGAHVAFQDAAEQLRVGRMGKHLAPVLREEKLAARKKTQMTPEELRKHQDMERLYRQEVLKEQPTLQIQGLGGAKKKQEVAEVVHKDVV